MIDSIPILLVFGEKGGVAKSTTAVSLAIYFATKHDVRVLLVDLDTARGGDCARLLGLEPAPEVYKLFADGEFHPSATRFPRLDILRGDTRTRAASRLVVDVPAHDTQRVFVDAVTAYDLCIVDTGPDSGPLRGIISALASFYVACTLTDGLGRSDLIKSVAAIQHTGIPYLVVPTRVQGRTLSGDAYAGMNNLWPGHVAPPIPEREAVKQAVEDQMSVWEYAGNGPQQYRKGAAEVAAAYEQVGAMILQLDTKRALGISAKGIA